MYLRPSFYLHQLPGGNHLIPPNIHFCFQKKNYHPTTATTLSSPLHQFPHPPLQALLSGGYRDFAMNCCRQQRLPPALCESIAERLESLTRRLPVKGPGLEAAKVAKAKAKVAWGGLRWVGWLDACGGI